MTAEATAKIYLATPRQFELSRFLPVLERTLDAAPVACLRLSLDSGDESELARAADAIRAIAHTRDVPLVIDRHWRMVGPHGLDGAHLLDTRPLREVRRALGQDSILGASCGASRHAGITAAEIGVDYVAFGPVGDGGLLGDGSRAELDLFAWWADVIEVPVVAEGGLTPDLLADLRTVADFVCLGDEIWLHPEGPEAALADAAAVLDAG